jgi:hypothetical protein
MLVHDESGKLVMHHSTVDIGLTGATLIHLLLTQRIEVIDGLVIPRDATSTGEPVSDRMLQAMFSLQHTHTPQTWIGWLAEGTYDLVSNRLIEAGVVTQATVRRLGLKPRTRYEVVDQNALVRAHARIRYAVLGFERPDPPTGALCALASILRLETSLYVNLPANEVLGRLDAAARDIPVTVREIVTAVDAAAAAATVALYR